MFIFSVFSEGHCIHNMLSPYGVELVNVQRIAVGVTCAWLRMPGYNPLHAYAYTVLAITDQCTVSLTVSMASVTVFSLIFVGKCTMDESI